jgi:hypothetical protein
MKSAEEEWDQSNLRLANYSQNGYHRLLLKKSGRLVWYGYQTYMIQPENFSKFKSFFPTLILKLQGTKLDKTWTQGSPQRKEYIPKRGFSQIQRFLF